MPERDRDVIARVIAANHARRADSCPTCGDTGHTSEETPESTPGDRRWRVGPPCPDCSEGVMVRQREERLVAEARREGAREGRLRADADFEARHGELLRRLATLEAMNAHLLEVVSGRVAREVPTIILQGALPLPGDREEADRD